MKILGVILFIVGAILFYGAKIVYMRNEKRVNNGNGGDKDFLALINQSMVVVRVIGGLMVIAGGVIIVFIR